MDKLPWALVRQWPANGVYRDIEKCGITAAHLPRTAMRREQVVIIKDDETFVSYCVNNKWTIPVKK